MGARWGRGLKGGVATCKQVGVARGWGVVSVCKRGGRGAWPEGGGAKVTQIGVV